MGNRMSQWDTLAVEFQQHTIWYSLAAILNSQRIAIPKREDMGSKKIQKFKRQNFNTRKEHVDVIICELLRSRETIYCIYPILFLSLHESFLLLCHRFFLPYVHKEDEINDKKYYFFKILYCGQFQVHIYNIIQ